MTKEELLMLNKPFCKVLSLYLVLAILVLTVPSQGWAMFIPTGEPGSVRQADMVSIQKTLESAVVKQRLVDFGLSSEEALSRINMLSDGQIHQFAANIDSLQAGADGVGALIFVLVVVILVIVILEASGRHVIIR
jgi:hypothetical protein